MNSFFNNAEQEWVADIEKRLFLVDYFKSIGKENDSIFQALYFSDISLDLIASAILCLSKEKQIYGTSLQEDLDTIHKNLSEFRRALYLVYNQRIASDSGILNKANTPLEDSFILQTLVLLGKASQNLSLATTILKPENQITPEFKDGLKNIQQRLHDFKQDLREIQQTEA